jgi:hypothetical protein
VKRFFRGIGIVLGLMAMPQVLFALDAVVTPSTSSASFNASARINLTTPDALAGIDERTPLLEVLRRRNIRTATLVNPGSFLLNWDPVYEAAPPQDYVSTSSSSRVTINGVDTGAPGGPLSAQCLQNTQTCNTVVENVVLSRQVIDQIVGILLEGVTLGDALGNRLPSRTVTVGIRRVWTHAGTSPEDHVAQFTLNVSARPDFNVQISQTTLIDITGSALSPVLPLGSPAAIPVNLQWTARLQTLGTPTPVTLRSDAAEVLTPDGQSLQRLARPLARPLSRARTLSEAFPNQGVASLSEVIADSLSIPASVAARARAAGFSSVIVRRTFSDGFNTRTGQVVLPLGSSSLAAFQITRVDLRYADGSRVKVVDRNQRLNAVADINYLGNGQLQAVWEWAPVAAGGAPFFRPIPASAPGVVDLDSPMDFDTRRSSTLVREFLNNQQRLKLISPVLPTAEQGGVLLRLRITAPDIVFELPVLRYYVGPDLVLPGTESVQPGSLRLLQPVGQGLIGPDTRFQWVAIPGASAYRLECYVDIGMSGGMVTGAVVPGDRGELSPSSLMLDHLQPGTGYWCRVVSIGEGGTLSAASDLIPLTAAN